MRIKLVDNGGPKPSIRVHKPSEKPLNTTTIGIRSKFGGGCLNPAISKESINWRRINNETNRRNMLQARFVPVPILVRPDGSRTVPKQYKRKVA